MAEYYYETRTKTGAVVAEVPGYSLQGEWFLSKPDQIRFSLPLVHEQVTRGKVEEGVHEIAFMRDDVSDPLFLGPLWDIVASSSDRSLNCSAEGPESYFEKRRIEWDLAYNGWERGEILWDLIRLSQLETNGDLGITKGAVQPSGVLGNQRFYEREGKYISTLAEEYAAQKVGGFDWKINTRKQFSYWSPSRTSAEPKLTLEYGENAPVTSVTLQHMGKFMSNDIKGLGPEGSIPVRAVDTVSRTKYGLMQRTESFENARTQEDLTDSTDYVLQARKNPKVVPTIVVHNQNFDPFTSNLVLGDQVYLYVNDGYIQYDQAMRYVGFQFSLSSQGKVSVNMYLNDLREVEDDGSV